MRIMFCLFLYTPFVDAVLPRVCSLADVLGGGNSRAERDSEAAKHFLFG